MALDQLEPVDLAFGLAAAPGLRQCSPDGRDVRLQSRGERRDRTWDTILTLTVDTVAQRREADPDIGGDIASGKAACLRHSQCLSARIFRKYILHIYHQILLINEKNLHFLKANLIYAMMWL